MAAAEQKLTTVTMDDERIVDFPGKRRLIKTSIRTPDGRLQVRLDFLNGESRLFTVPEALLADFALHGAEQKLGDEIAGIEDLDDCIMAVDALTERLNAGEWLAKREAGNGMAGTSILARALVEHSGKTMSAIKTFLLNKTQAEKMALRSNQAIQPIVARLQAEKDARSSAKAPKVDTETLLSELA